MKAACVCIWVTALLLLTASLSPAAQSFRAGAYAMDVTPTNFPVIVNGGFLSKTANRANDRLHVRWLVLDDGRTRVALGVLDTCVIPSEFADEVKTRARKLTGIPTERMMLSATHTHSAPSLMTCLGTDADPNYPAFAVPRIVDGLQHAISNLAPARLGWAVTQAPELTHTRVWIRRPDKMLTDPFGGRTARANMHPGHQNPDTIGPAGPSDPALTLLAVQSLDGQPVAVLANFAMHYFGAPAISADYYGVFAGKLGQLLDAPPAFVGIMSQGYSGDQHWMDYSQPKRNAHIGDYATQLAQLTVAAYKAIKFQDQVPLAMREQTLRLATRQPDEKRLAWARDTVEKMNGRTPKTIPEVYAREQLWLKDNPTRQVKLQAFRVGDLGITATPNEVFAITSLKIKAQSPLQPTMNIELAGGEEGYIPPPELHVLGGYNTWACRSASLEVDAEPKIVDALLDLLEDVSGQPRRKVAVTHGAYAQAVLTAKPLAYWRLDEWSGPVAHDATGARRHATYEGGVARWLDGPQFTGETNRCPHFAGGRLNATLKEWRTIEFWAWDGIPGTGHLIELDGEPVALKPMTAKTWHHFVLLSDGTVYRDGVAGEPVTVRPATKITLGAGFEGKIDEVAIYDRALSAEEINQHYQLAGLKP